MDWFRGLFRLALGRRLPRHDGEIQVSGCREPVTIRRDEYGVPYIEAGRDEDVWFGLGFCHGQDRGGQLELTLRTVRGTLSEVVGPETLGIDRLVRRIGFREAGAGQLRVADDETRGQLAAYAQGINEGMRRGGRPAHELTLLGCEPTEWTANDVQAFLSLLCFALAANWDVELVRLKVLQLDGAEALTALDPTYPEWLPVSAPPGAAAGGAIDRLAQDVRDFARSVGVLGASNAWAVSAAKTRTGRPILAGDPHLNPVAPCQWYLTRLSTPDWSAAGATFVGIPAIVSGHNGFAAWGVTAGHADNADLFVEQIGPDGRSVRSGSGFEPCPVRREVIPVKGREPVVEDVLLTPRGPIVSPAFEGQDGALSLSATWLEPEPYEGLLGIHKVQSVSAFREVFERNSTSTVSLVYADVEGHLAWQLAMALPRRKKGNGTLPLPGWDPDVGWEADGIPHADLPFAADPAEGYLCTANNQPVVEDGGPFLGVDWLDGYRQARIGEALSARDDWDVAGHMALQMETRSIPWREMRGQVLAVEPRTEAARQARELLERWDGRVEPDSVGASVFEMFVAEMCQRIVRAKAPRSAAWALGRGFNLLLHYNLMVTRRLGHLVRLITEQPDGFFSRPWSVEMAEALDEVVGRLRRLSANPEAWAWGLVRPFRLVHPFGERFPLDRVFNIGPFPGRGDSSTVHQGAVDLEEPTANIVGLPTHRMVVDVGNWDASRFVLLGGQSGNPLSPHYADQTDLWQQGRGIPIHWSDAAVARATQRTLRLVPGAGAGGVGAREAGKR